MCKLEKLFLSVILGAIFPLVGFLAGWWSTSQLPSNGWILAAALGGLVCGVIIDAVFLERWVAGAYKMDIKLWMAVYFFYAICVFGFFMGVPVFNVALAIPAGLIIGRKLAYQKVAGEEENQLSLKTDFYVTGVMVFICASSAFLALRDPTTAANLEGMLGLPFVVTQVMIIALIAVGGACLLVINWWLVKKSIKFARGTIRHEL